MYPFERFSEQSKRVLTRAQEEAERSHKSYIGTEHLLLGLFQVDGAMAPRILADLGVESESVRRAITVLLGSDERIAMRQIIPTSRVKRVIEIAFEEARRSGDGHVGTDHLLLALLIEGQGIAARVLIDLGVTQVRVREAMSRLSATGVQEDAAPPGPQPAQPPGGGTPMPDPHRMAGALDDLTAVELLAALLERFGASGPPPPRLLELTVELRRVRHRKRAAVSADDYDAAKQHHEAEERLHAEAAAELEAWRKQQG